jgi:dihydrolipoamide dehydrogenase
MAENKVTENKRFDVVVIGGGPGGYSSAVRAAQLGLGVALVEKEAELGGICLNWGCIPTKALLRQAEMYRLFQRADEFGIQVDGLSFDWGQLIGRSRKVAAELAGGVAGLMRKNKVQVFKGRARLRPTGLIEIEGHEGCLEAGQTILATGSRPLGLPGIAIDGKRILSSRQAMNLPKQPKSLAIIGAGAIGVEFAYFFNAFGTQVTLLETAEQILPREDAEIAALLAEDLQQQGIAIETGVRVESVEGTRTCQVRYAGKSLRAEKVLMAVGVEGNCTDLGLEALGVQLQRGGIAIDGRMRTNIKGIYAIGDVAGPPQLAHVAAAQGIAAVEFAAGIERPEIDADAVPSCTYCQPQVASIGLNEAEAKSRGIEVKVGRFPFAASGKARAAGETQGLVKLVFGARYGEILGASIIGSEATELIAEVGLGLSLEATYEEFLQTMHAHPTLSEAVMEAAGAAFGEAINI